MRKHDFSKQCLATSLLELLKERPLEEISVRDLVEKSGFSRMTYYRNFSSLEQLLDYYLKCYTMKWIEEDQFNFDEISLKEYFVRTFQHFAHEDTRELFDLLHKRGLILHVYSCLDSYFVCRPNIQKKFYYCFISGGTFNTYLRWAESGYKETPEELAETLLQYIKSA